MNELEELEMTIDAIRNEPMNNELYIRRGIAWYNCKCFDECVSDLLFYEANCGSDPRLYKYLGLALDKTNGKRSLEYLKKYVGSNPDDTDMTVYLAESFFQMADYQKSIVYYQKAVENGYNPEIMRVKASMLAESKMYDEAGLFDPAFGKKKSLFRR